MFANSYQARVEKHVSVFRKAAEGLQKVQADILAHMKSLSERNDSMRVAIEDNKKEMESLGKHSESIGETVSKIAALLP